MTDSPDVVLREYLHALARGEGEPMSEELIEQFGEMCKNTIRKFTQPVVQEPFRLRMSNAGKGARSLWLEKEYGREPKTPEFTLKMLYAHLAEHTVLSMMKAAGVNVEFSNEKVELTINERNILGEYDVKIDGKHWDFKTASPYSYEHKFDNVDSLKAMDDFGYIGQAILYSMADQTPFGGWVALNLVSGEFKTVDGSSLNTKEQQSETVQHVATVIRTLDGEIPPPPCTGVEEETFRKKPTGNYRLNRSCAYCPHKSKCHPGIIYQQSPMSKAKNPTWHYYTKINPTNLLEEENEQEQE